MKKSISILVMALLLSAVSFAQPLTGVKTIPGDYPTIAAAITALNTSGVGPGGVTFNVNAGHNEAFPTATSGRITTATSSASNPVVFQKSGAGNNPSIRAAAGTGTMDAIIVFNGTDYVTFDGIDLLESGTNANTTSMMEWGFAILKTSPSNGAQNITIRNCTITLNKNNPDSKGIYSANHTVANFNVIPVNNITGTNSNLKIYNNVINNSYMGIHVSGHNAAFPYTFYDQNVEIGVDGGNVITNVGGAPIDSYGIYVRRVNNLKLANNTVTSTTIVTNYSPVYFYIYGIYLTDAFNASFDVYNNTVSMNFSTDDPNGNHTLNAMYIEMGENGTNNVANIYNNTVSDCVYSTFAHGSVARFIHLRLLGYTTNVYGNVVSGNTVGGASGFPTSGEIQYIRVQKLSQVQGPVAVYNNTITNNSRIQLTPQGGITYYLFLAGNGTTLQAYNNIIDNNIIGSEGGTYGIWNAFNGSVKTEIFNNSFINHTEANGSVSCLYLASPGLVSHYYNNTVHNISSSNSAIYSRLVGIYMSEFGGTSYIYNNMISDLRNPASQATEGVAYNVLSGIYVDATNNVRGVYNNTVYLNTTINGTQTNYGSAAFATMNLNGIDLRNNIFVNTSQNTGTMGKTVAILSRTTNTGFFTSNFNNLYAGTPGPKNLIFFNGTSAAQTLVDYKTFITPQELQSVTELPPFVNIAARPYDLHLKTNVPTQCESGGTVVSSPLAITTDIDGNPRFPNPGYPVNIFYTPNAPDIGADEFGGVASDLIPPAINFTPVPNASNANPVTLTTVITDGTGVPTSGIGLPRLFWKKNNGVYQAVTATWVSDTTYTFTFGGGTVLGDVISYYFVAQDTKNPPNVGATPMQGAAGFSVNPPACATPPSSPFTYSHVNTISGVFHVGVGKTYTTLTAAVNDLNSKNMSGPVTFILDDATYPNETYPINFYANAGSSPINTLTIKPNAGVSPSLTGSVQYQPILRFIGLDHVILDGSNNGGTSRNLTFRNNSSSYNASVISITNTMSGDATTNLTIKNCNLIGNNLDINTETYVFLFYENGGPTGGGYNNIVIENNWIKSAKNGINVFAQPTTKNNNISITGNTIGSTEPDEYLTRYGIAVTQTYNILIADNEIMGAAGGSDGVSQFGIYTYDHNKNVKITNNIIHDWISTGPGSQGIRYDNDNNETVAEISNNVIYNIGAWGLNPGPAFTQAHGIMIRRGGNIRIWHNSVHLSGPYLYGFDSYAPSSGCIVFWNESFVNSQDYDVRNNILRNSMTNDHPNPGPDAWGKAYGIMFKNTISGLYTENNNYYIDGYQGEIAMQYCVGGICFIQYPTLEDWRDYTGYDVNSTDINPQFTSTTNLVPTNLALDNLGVYIPQVPTDVTGATRSNPPDMGAYEFGTAPLVHNINIPAGWSGISSYLKPNNPSMASVLSPIMNNLDILYNFNGMYYPGGNIYTLNSWNEYDGYAIKVNQAVTLPIGPQEITNKTVELEQGWNFIPVLSPVNYSITSLFTGVSGFEMAKDIAGVGVYWPAYGINTIGNVLPGKAYYVRMNNTGSITYNSLKSNEQPEEINQPETFINPWNEVIVTPGSHLVLFNIGGGSLQAGDIIGGFNTGGICAGAALIGNPAAAFTLSLNGDDMSTTENEGFAAGNLLTYKVYRPSTGETFDITATYENESNKGYFESNGISIVKSVTMSATGIADNSLTGLRIYPNPSKGVFIIEGMNQNVNIRIYNAFGDEIYNSVNLTLSIDLSSHPKGIYVAKIQYGTAIKFEKLVIN